MRPGSTVMVTGLHLKFEVVMEVPVRGNYWSGNCSPYPGAERRWLPKDEPRHGDYL
jgi:hypothetical protein